MNDSTAVIISEDNNHVTSSTRDVSFITYRPMEANISGMQKYDNTNILKEYILTNQRGSIFRDLEAMVSAVLCKAKAARKRVSIIEKIEKFAELPENWNHYGAVSVEPIVVKNALAIVNQLNIKILDKVTSVFPYPHGTIALKWINNCTGDLLSLEIGDDSFSGYSKKGNETIEFNGALKEGHIRQENLLQIENAFSAQAF